MDFSALYQKDFQILDIFLMEQDFWKKHAGFHMKTPRPTDALLYFERAEGVCYPENGAPFSIQKGDLVYIARGAQYRWKLHKSENEVPITWLFNFTLADEKGKPIRIGEDVQLVQPESPELCRLLFKGLLEEAQRPLPFPATLRAKAYALLAEVIKTHHRGNPALTEGIRKGLLYLENDDVHEKSMEEIAAACHMSLSSFEKQFKACTGLTPSQFRLERRLERAELLLRNTSLPIHLIAETLGFYDAAAFCKLFKKKKGVSPSEMR